jgi:hypothetical protein
MLLTLLEEDFDFFSPLSESLRNIAKDEIPEIPSVACDLVRMTRRTGAASAFVFFSGLNISGSTLFVPLVSLFLGVISSNMDSPPKDFCISPRPKDFCIAPRPAASVVFERRTRRELGPPAEDLDLTGALNIVSVSTLLPCLDPLLAGKDSPAVKLLVLAGLRRTLTDELDITVPSVGSFDFSFSSAFSSFAVYFACGNGVFRPPPPRFALALLLRLLLRFRPLPPRFELLDLSLLPPFVDSSSTGLSSVADELVLPLERIEPRSRLCVLPSMETSVVSIYSRVDLTRPVALEVLPVARDRSDAGLVSDIFVSESFIDSTCADLRNGSE